MLFLKKTLCRQKTFIKVLLILFNIDSSWTNHFLSMSVIIGVTAKKQTKYTNLCNQVPEILVWLIPSRKYTLHANKLVAI